jgi:predicted small secreted protein
MMTLIRTTVSVLLLAIAAVAFWGCNTVRGVGKDIEAGGKAIQRTTR